MQLWSCISIGYFPHSYAQSFDGLIDSAQPQISAGTMQLHTSKKILLKVIPYGTTILLQPVDVCHFAKLKTLVQPRIDAWITAPPKPSMITRWGNRKAPTVEVYSSWLIESWNSFGPKYILKSFQTFIFGIISRHYISKHDDYGDTFIQTYNQVRTDSLDVEVNSDDASDPGDIDYDSELIQAD
jgi:hypothetical protein